MLESLDESDLSPGSRLLLPSPSEHLASVSVCRFLRLGSFYPADWIATISAMILS